MKVDFSMVLFLVLDVFDQTVNLALRASERPVALLPMGESLENLLLFNPKRGARFNLLDKVGEADGGMKAGENMQVVIHAVDAIKVTLAISDDPGDVAKEVFTAVLRKGRRSVLRGKNDVVADGRVG